MVEIRELNRADDVDVRGYYDAYVAAQSAGNPGATVHSYAETVASLRGPSGGWTFQVLVAVDESAVDLPHGIIGGAMSGASILDNLHASWIAVHVRSEHRSAGVGTALLAAIEDHAAADGRSQLTADVVLDGTHAGTNRRFAERHGYRWSYSEVERRLPLPLGDDLLDRLDATVAPYRPGYRIVAFDGPIPDRWATGYCAVGNRLSADAPHGDLEMEESRRTPEQLRAQDAQITASGRHRLTALALKTTDGAELTDGADGSETVAALCTCVVSEKGAESVDQWATIVDREHRGHRLGMSVKVACYRLLAEFATEKRYVETGNAETNRWMIAINEQLGFAIHSQVGVFAKRR
jgi:GNAT superfamily N-acetyltransferase